MSEISEVGKNSGDELNLSDGSKLEDETFPKNAVKNYTDISREKDSTRGKKHTIDDEDETVPKNAVKTDNDISHEKDSKRGKKRTIDDEDETAPKNAAKTDTDISREKDSTREKKGMIDDVDDATDNDRKKVSNHAQTVAEHYNSLKENGITQRLKSPIFYMRNFNNWIKGMVIEEFLQKVKSQKTYGATLRVLDLCCGKGGDLFKWQIGNVGHLICADIASVSIEHCKDRYNFMKGKSDRGREKKIFSAEFIAADCTTSRLRQMYKSPAMEIDLVSCQFAFHYGFESLPQAMLLLQNASEMLKSGGYFIGTIPDAYDILSRAKKSEENKFGNEIFNVHLQFNPDEGVPLFGAKYNFHLEGVVDCPEFLVHFPTFVELAKKFDLELVFKKRFEDYYKEKKEEGTVLLNKMQCLEVFPPHSKDDLLSKRSGDYEHAEKYLEKSGSESNRPKNLGTISKSEWEAATIYIVFAFQKMKSKSKDCDNTSTK